MGRVLVVDDDQALRSLMRLELGDTYEIIDSGEPEQGLALALEYKPDAILLDLRMPKYSGYELLQSFTSLASTKTIPVIVVSGEAGGQTKEHCKELGAAGYFEKPIDFDELRACLHQVAKKRRHIPRSEVRVRLTVALRLRGSDNQGKNFEEAATTEDVSVSGFLCRCNAKLLANSILDVYLGGHAKVCVGKAKIVHSHVKAGSIWYYGCRFIEKTGKWLLQ
jgi:DNA-binding response OmpR family regulator